MNRKILFLLLFFVSFPCLGNTVVNFEPTNVSLKGTVITLTFAGPPNYESIKNGDKAETRPYLILSKPIDIKLPKTEAKNAATNEPQTNVKLIQLIVVNKNDWQNLKKGNYVEVKGTLSSSLTGHHHARALLTINKINVLAKKKISNKLLNNITPEDKKYLELNSNH